MNDRLRRLIAAASVGALALYQIPAGYSCFAAAQQTVTSGGASGSAGQATGDYENAVKPLIQQNCVGCHNPTKLKGDVDLQQFLGESADQALKSRDVFELVIQKLRAGEMPPPGRPRPPADQVAAATQWIESQYAALDSKLPPNPGRVTAHRLNRYEYNNTVRDLLGVNLRFAEELL